jgi:histidinol phosphatase-like PHP family hydrolase
MDSYIRHMLELKEKYRDRIEVLIGLEVDYIPGYESWRRHLLAEYGKWLDDGILSVHFLPGAGGWRCIDRSPQDVVDGLIRYYGSVGGDEGCLLSHGARFCIGGSRAVQAAAHRSYDSVREISPYNRLW